MFLAITESLGGVINKQNMRGYQVHFDMAQCWLYRIVHTFQWRDDRLFSRAVPADYPDLVSSYPSHYRPASVSLAPIKQRIDYK